MTGTSPFYKMMVVEAVEAEAGSGGHGTGGGQGTGGNRYSAAEGALVMGDYGRTCASTLCFRCNRYGHFADHRPDNTDGQTTGGGGTSTAGPSPGGEGSNDNAGDEVSAKDAYTFLQRHVLRGKASTAVRVGFSFTQNHSPSSFIDLNWILLDSESTVNVFRNKELLTDVGLAEGNEVLTVLTNGGSQVSTTTGCFGGLGNVWYNPQSLANILSLALVIDTLTEKGG